MKITKASFAGFMLGLSLVAACRGSDNDATPDAPGGGDGGTDSGKTEIQIKDIHESPTGTAIAVNNVVVTAIDTFGAKTGSFWVQDFEGGAYSGIQVFNGPTAVVATLKKGDVVNISGAEMNQFIYKTDTSGRLLAELQPPKGGAITVVKTGATHALPAPHVIDLAAIDAMSATDRDAEYAKWESSLVQVKNVRTRSYPVSFSSASAPYPEDSYKVSLSDSLVLESTQAKFGAIDGLTCFASITGIQDYFFDWLLEPTSADDYVAGTDCAPLATTASTITALQATTPSGAITLENVYVTGISANKTSMWISTSPTAAVNEGGYVFQPSKSVVLDPTIVVGARVNITGTVSEFNDDTSGGTLTEIAPLRISVVDSTAAVLAPITGKTVTELLVAATAPTYESVLVTLDNVKITELGVSDAGYVATGVQAGTSFKIGTDILRLADADKGCYKTVTGFWTNLVIAGVTTKPNSFGFIVRTLGDKGVDGTDCK